MFIETDTIKYIVSLTADLSTLCEDAKAGKVPLDEAAHKYEELKKFYKELVVRRLTWVDVYRAYFIDYPTFNDLLAHTVATEVDMGEA